VIPDAVDSLFTFSRFAIGPPFDTQTATPPNPLGIRTGYFARFRFPVSPAQAVQTPRT